jgi:hypothetical protein
MAFAENLYEVVKGAVSPDILKFCQIEFEMLRKVMYITNGRNEADKFAFNDNQITNSFSHYSALCFETLSQILLPKMQEVTGKKLYPTYTYARIYYNQAEMTIHTDRPSCEYSTTVCIENDPDFGPWEIWFKSLEGKEFSIDLEPGDALVYKGDILEHWRTPYQGQRQMQAFLHYVDKFGPHRDYKYDRRAYTGLPADFKR